MEADTEFLSSIRAANSRAGVSWEAGMTPMMSLTQDQRQLHMGFVPGPGDLSLDERERVSREARARAPVEEAAREAKFPAQWDWRNKDGRSFISAVKNQGACGTCAAFAVVAVIDAMMRISLDVATGDPGGGLMPDLSEGQLFWCGRPDASCEIGWRIGEAMGYPAEYGLVPDTVYPWADSSLGCRLSLIKSWESLVTKTSGSQSLALETDGADAMKQWLSTKGPLATGFVVYDDFLGYKSGVYKWNGTSPRSDKYKGHGICVIGYSENLQAWLCKNSWGTNWGDGGYCYIGYGECGIDAEMWGVKGVSTIYPFFKATGKPAACVYSGDGFNQMHYCYRDTDGHIRDIIWSGSSWTAQQLTGPGGLTDGPKAASDPTAVVYSGTGFNQTHYFYCGPDGFIWDLVWSGADWSAQRVTGKNGLAGSGTPAKSDLAVAVYSGNGSNEIHCCYRDEYFNVSHVVLSGGVWKVNVVPSGGKLPIGNLAVAAYSGTGFNQLHCCFQGKDGYIYDMILNGSNWSVQQVTGAGGQAGGPAGASGSNPAVIVYSGDGFNQMHYCYRDQDGNIQDAVYDDYGKRWSMQQVTGTDQNAKTHGPKAAGDVAMVAYGGDGFNQIHYCYRDQDGNIQDAAYDAFGKGWSIQNLTGPHGQTNGPAAASDPVLFVYGGTGFNQRHCCYRDTTGYLQDAFWDANARRWSRQII